MKRSITIYNIYMLLFLVLLVSCSEDDAIQNDPPVLSKAAFFIGELAETGSIVGTISATDLEGDQFTFSIIDGNTNSVFAINESSGDLTLKAKLDYEEIDMYTLIVRAEDDFGSAQQSYVIHILDETE